MRDSRDGIINYLIAWAFIQGDKRGTYGLIGIPNYKCPKNQGKSGGGGHEK